MNNDSYWSTRRSIRKFTQQPVSDEMIDNMLELAAQAPTTGNMQLYSVVVTRDVDTLAQLYPAHFNQPAATGAPVLLTFCADLNRFTHWCEISGADPGYDNFQSFMAAVFDATIFAQQFVTIAEQQGLGTCYLGTTTYNAPDIAKALELPRMVVPLLTVALGYPDENGVVSDRLPIDAIRHKNTYHMPTDDDVMFQYAPKESLAENQKFVSENGKQTLAQVFTDVRYPRANNEHFSEVLIDFLRNNGLL